MQPILIYYASILRLICRFNDCSPFSHLTRRLQYYLNVTWLMLRAVVLLLYLSVSVFGQLDGIYCGNQTCFDGVFFALKCLRVLFY